MKTNLYCATSPKLAAVAVECRRIGSSVCYGRIPLLMSLLFGCFLVLSAGVSVADENPPGCSLVNGGKGNSSSAGLNFNVATAHIGETVALFATAGMVTNACSATEATGTIYTSAGLLGNFLNNVTLSPGIILSCPADGDCVPGPYSFTITKEMIGAKIVTPIGTVSGMPGYVRAVGSVTGHVHSGQYIDELAGFHTASVAIVDCAGALVLDPDHYAVKDLCGVCGGDNSTCKDCAGVPNGDSKLDVCGVCDGNGTTCLGCDETPNSQKVFDACGICGGDGTSCKDCAGVPNGGAKIDLCGVCNGNSTTCLDCKGVPNGTNKIDSCGVCGGDGMACITSCIGTIDACGVCNGSNACLDCAGIPNGTTAIDCCGICGGDGSTCADKCKTYDLKKIKAKISSSLKSLLVMINKYSGQQSGCDSAMKKAAAKRIASSKILVAKTNSLLKVYVGDKIKLCNTVFCSKTSLVDVIKTAKTNIRKLYNLSVQSQYAAGTACKVARRDGGKPGKSNTDLKNGLNGLGKVPPAHCGN